MSGKLAARIPLLASVLLLWIAPLMIAPTAKESFRLPKLLASEALVLVILLAFLLRLRRARFDPRSLWRLPAVQIALPLLAAAVLSVLASPHPAHGLRALGSLAIGLACLLAWSLGLRRGEHRALLRLLIWPAMVLAVLVILQFHGLYEPFEFEGEMKARYGLTSLAGNAFDLAAYLLLPALVAQVEWRRAASRGGRIFWVVGFAICVYGIVITQTLGVLVALAVAYAVLWAKILPRRRFLTLTAAALGLALLAVALVEPLRFRVGNKLSSLGEGDLEQVLSGRPDGWRAALWMWRQEPLLGIGHGCYVTEFGHAKLALIDRGTQFFKGHRNPYFANAHNDPLEVVAEQGLVGGLALAWALWVLTQAYRRRSGVGLGDQGLGDQGLGNQGLGNQGLGNQGLGDQASDDQGPDDQGPDDRALQLAALAGLSILALIDFVFRIALTAYPAILLLSWILAAPRAAQINRDSEPDDASPSAAPLALALAPILLVLLVLQMRHGADRLQASRLLNTAEGITLQAEAAGKLTRRVAQHNISLLRTAAELDPLEVGIPVARGGQYLLLDNPRAAIKEYEKALALQPTAEVFANLGRALRRDGRSAEADQAIRNAVRIDPTWAEIFGLPSDLETSDSP